MADDGETLFREILENPEDDAPRLVYADWLQQRGDADSVARGELIYAQCAVEHAETRDRPALVTRIRELVKRNGRNWTSQLRERHIGSRWKFRRGFVDSGVVSATRFVVSASDMFALAPTLRVFRFPEASNELIKLVECEFFSRVIEADLTTMCSCGSCKIEREHPKLFASPYATNLRVLKMGDCRITDANAKLLAESTVLANLNVLDLSQNRITGTGGEAIAKAPFAAMRELSLRGNHLGAGANAFAKSRRPWLDTIATLDLRDNDLEPATIAALRERFGRRVRC